MTTTEICFVIQRGVLNTCLRECNVEIAYNFQSAHWILFQSIVYLHSQGLQIRYKIKGEKSSEKVLKMKNCMSKKNRKGHFQVVMDREKGWTV